MKPLMTLPCKNKHSDMEKKEAGYYCKSCDHVLTDFRNASEEEIQTTIHGNPGKICGIFHSNQLDYKVSHIQVPAFKAVGLSLLGILGFLGPVVTSCETDPATEHKQNAFNLLKFPMHIRGTVRDENTDRLLPNFPIQLLQHNRVIKQGRTNQSGYFDILVTEKDLDEEIFSFVLGDSHMDTLSENIQKFKYKKVRLSIQAEASDYEPGKVKSHTIGFVPPKIKDSHYIPVAKIHSYKDDTPLPEEPKSNKNVSDLAVVGVITDIYTSHAEFPGGRNALIKFIQDHAILPQVVSDKNISGKVYLRFEIEKDGSITHTEVKKGITDCPECDEEALRVVKLMPKWIPAEKDGTPTSSWYTLPIVFKETD